MIQNFILFLTKINIIILKKLKKNCYLPRKNFVEKKKKTKRKKIKKIF